LCFPVVRKGPLCSTPPVAMVPMVFPLRRGSRTSIHLSSSMNTEPQDRHLALVQAGSSFAEKCKPRRSGINLRESHRRAEMESQEEHSEWLRQIVISDGLVGFRITFRVAGAASVPRSPERTK